MMGTGGEGSQMVLALIRKPMVIFTMDSSRMVWNMAKDNSTFVMATLIRVNTLMACLKDKAYTFGMMVVNIKEILSKVWEAEKGYGYRLIIKTNTKDNICLTKKVDMDNIHG